MLEGTGFTVENWKMKLAGRPTEDAFQFDFRRGILVCADGVTRDCLNGNPVERTLSGFYNTRLFYPRPSPAAEVAQITCAQFRNRAISQGLENAHAIGSSFWAVNHLYLKGFNKRYFPEPDYLVDDLAGCTASAAVVDIERGVTRYGFIADSGVAIVGADGSLKMRTPDEGPNNPENERYLRPHIEKRGGWKSSQARQFIRRDVRNNPDPCVFERHTFGVLTGEEAALQYIRTGEYELNEGDRVIAYTDGVVHTLFKEDGDISDDVAGMIRDRRFNSLKPYFQKRVRTEGTLVVGCFDFR